MTTIPRMYIIDAELISLKLSERLVDHSGLVKKSYCFQDPEIALARAKAKKTLILLEITISNMNGFELINSLKAFIMKKNLSLFY